MPTRRRAIRLVLTHAAMAASGLGLLASAALVSGAPLEQAEIPSLGAALRVATADGKPLDLRAGPALDQPIVGQLAPDEVVTVIGASLVVGPTRWLPVSTPGNQLGWIPAEYVVAVSAPAPPASPAPDPAFAEPAPASSPEPTIASGPAVPATPEPGRPVEIEAKLKYPEAKGRHQEITIWVTRDGRPIEGATVTVFAEDDDDEPLRTLELTNAEGRTWREFAIGGRAKGSISLVVSAEAPDGGKGRTEVSYFIR